MDGLRRHSVRILIVVDSGWVQPEVRMHCKQASCHLQAPALL